MILGSLEGWDSCIIDTVKFALFFAWLFKKTYQNHQLLRVFTCKLVIVKKHTYTGTRARTLTSVNCGHGYATPLIKISAVMNILLDADEGVILTLSPVISVTVVELCVK